MDGKSLDIAQEKLEHLKQILPEVFSEGQLDIEKLRLAVGEDIAIQDERYVLNWAGKGDAFRALQTPTTATLAPAREESVNFDDTENIFIEGENLEVLKVLQKAYYGKVKMIYIDPPYNTGNDSFVYPDRFSESREDYMKRIQAKDEEGNLLREGQFRQNSRDGGHYHSNWLTMMYPRLFLARNLLREDGVIFVSIDDNEVHNLRLLMNEIFGEENFIGMFAVQLNPRGRHLDKFIAQTHEYVLVFAKDINTNSMFQLPKPEEMLKEYNQEDEHGRYRELGLRNRNPAFNSTTRPNLYYPLFVNPKNGEVGLETSELFSVEVLPFDSNGNESCWTWGKPKVQEEHQLLVARKTNGGEWRVFRKDYLIKNGEIATTLPKSVWLEREINNDYGKRAIQGLFGKNQFDFPKSPHLLQKIIQLGSEEGIVLDFFAGSGTTAHGLLLQNLADGKQRKFILVQLPEVIEDGDYEHIADIGLERIRLSIQKFIEENPMFAEQGQDLGVRVFKLKHSNFKLWRGDGIEEDGQLVEQLEMLADPVMEEAQEENMLMELLLKSGFSLTTPVSKQELGEGHYWLAQGEDGATLTMALHSLSEELIAQVVQGQPQQFICLDRLFESDQIKTNTQLQCKDAGIVFHSI